MIDLHTHILPAIDDGAKTREESLAIINELYSQGVDTIVFTPHYYAQKRSVEEFLIERQNAFDSIKDGIPVDVKTVLAAEVNIGALAGKDFRQIKPLAIQNTEYIMLEMPHRGEWTDHLFDKIDNIMYTTDLTPIIVHAEKYSAVLTKPNLLQRLIDMGCLIQVTCDSFLENTPFMKAMLKHGQAHCLGSDAHNMEARKPKYFEAVDFLQKHGGNELEKMQENMTAVLDNKTVQTYDGGAIKKVFGFYF